MIDQTDATAAEPDRPGAARHATLEELLAEPERVAGEAAASPVHIDGPGGASLVLLSAEAFERLQRHVPRAMLASELCRRRPRSATIRRYRASAPTGHRFVNRLGVRVLGHRG